MDIDSIILSTSARLHTRATSAELLALATTKAIDPSVFAERDPYFVSAEISNTNIDAYFTQMQPSTLRNFVSDATNGVTLLNSHNGHKLGWGRSVHGTFTQTGETAKAEADFYTLPGLQLNDVNTDDLIIGVRAGILFDVSVGFYGGVIRCNCCGRDMMRDWDCWHIPGITYQVEDSGNRIVRETLALGLVEEARLAEVSIVYDGATPGASILKAQQEATNGRMNDTQIRLFEQRYRMRLPERRIQIQGGITAERIQKGDPMTDPIPQEEPVSNDAPTSTPENTETAEVRSVLDGVESGLGESLTRGVQAVVTRYRDAVAQRDSLQRQIDALTAERQTLASEVSRLAPLADLGVTYRKDLVADTLAQGVRAFGAEFAEETYKALLETATIDTIKRMNADWRKVADAVFPKKRVTTDSVEEPKKKAGERKIPAQAYS